MGLELGLSIRLQCGIVHGKLHAQCHTVRRHHASDMQRDGGMGQRSGRARLLRCRLHSQLDPIVRALRGGSQTCMASGSWGSCSGGSSPRTYYRDMDGDGYGNAGVTTSACSAPSGYVSDNTDCYDNNYNAHPRQGGWFTTNRGDGSFDYNCDGAETQEVPPSSVFGGCIGNCCSQTGSCVAGTSTCGPNFEESASGLGGITCNIPRAGKVRQRC